MFIRKKDKRDTYVNNGYTKTFGQIFIKDNFESFTILYNGWDSEKGFMVAAPSKNREEAVEISNKLMDKYLATFHIDEIY